MDFNLIKSPFCLKNDEEDEKRGKMIIYKSILNLGATNQQGSENQTDH